MKTLDYIDKTGAIGTLNNSCYDVSTGKLKLKGFYTAIKHSFFGDFVVNITETLNGYSLVVSTPPAKFSQCCASAYQLDNWCNFGNVAHARHAAHKFIERKRRELINEYKKDCKMYQKFRIKK